MDEKDLLEYDVREWDEMNVKEFNQTLGEYTIDYQSMLACITTNTVDYPSAERAEASKALELLGYIEQSLYTILTYTNKMYSKINTKKANKLTLVTDE